MRRTEAGPRDPRGLFTSCTLFTFSAPFSLSCSISFLSILNNEDGRHLRSGKKWMSSLNQYRGSSLDIRFLSPNWLLLGVAQAK
jgi:hypothetical protein